MSVLTLVAGAGLLFGLFAVDEPAVAGFASPFIVAGLLGAAFSFGVGIGLWRLSPWAWRLEVVWLWLSVLSLWTVPLLLYMYQSRIRRLFREKWELTEADKQELRKQRTTPDGPLTVVLFVALALPIIAFMALLTAVLAS